MDTLTHHSERLLAHFLEMVRIDSPSGEEDAMREYLAAHCLVRGWAHATDAGGNLIVEVPAIGCNHSSRLVLSGHMDVVPPCLGVQPQVTGTGDDRIITSDTTTVLGADDKAGLAVILEALEITSESQLPRPPIRLLFTTREETSLGGAKDLADNALDAQFAITLDHTGEQGTIIHQAPSYYEFTITCQGKSVHAGIMPEKGVSALMLATRIVDQLHLGRIDPLTTANIGFIEGGKATNIVPDQVVVRGELRGHDPDTLQQELDYIQSVVEQEAAAMAGASATVASMAQFYAYRIPEDDACLQRVVSAARQTGLTPKLIATNGGSDNNVFVHRGLPGVVLSAGYVAPHSLKEQVHLRELSQSTRFLVNILAAFAAEPF
jgi:tripeptide aminopeptidase